MTSEESDSKHSKPVAHRISQEHFFLIVYRSPFSLEVARV